MKVLKKTSFLGGTASNETSFPSSWGRKHPCPVVGVVGVVPVGMVQVVMGVAMRSAPRESLYHQRTKRYVPWVWQVSVLMAFALVLRIQNQTIETLSYSLS